MKKTEKNKKPKMTLEIRQELIMSSEAYRRLDQRLEAVIKVIKEKLGVEIK
ncbi:MAG: hypothetical protein HYV52_01400 [Parcubacteria group bacterium]|nr:hypothetical protein [Parcubacteria group bacterium]